VLCAVCAAQQMLYKNMLPTYYCMNIKFNASTPDSYHYHHYHYLYFYHYYYYYYYSDNIAHNLITPIQSINMGIELLKSEYSAVIGESNQDQPLFLCCF
jgi:hypothetical protein